MDHVGIEDDKLALGYQLWIQICTPIAKRIEIHYLIKVKK